MIGEILQEYLVSLGVQIDKPGFQEMDRTIKASEQTVEKATGAWAANFLKASAVIGSAIAGITAAVGGLMNSAAKEDLVIQKLARNMMISKDAALEMKRATDAMGESVNDILLTPELLDGFRQLTKEGRQMKIGGDFAETMKNFRDLTFEFTRLKQEASYAMTWVGYYLMKYLQKPLNEIGEKFRRFNDSFIKNMGVWTEKVARAMVYVINIGKHFLEFLWDIGKALYGIWDSFPKGVKIAIASLAGLWAVINASPLSRMILLVSTLLLLLDDYYGYMEGKDAALGKYWDKLNGYIEAGKRLWEEYKPVVMEALDTVVEYLVLAKDTAIEFAGKAKKAFDDIVNSQGSQEFLEIARDIVQAFKELGGGIIEAVTSLFGSFYDGMKDNGAGRQFSGLLDRIVGLIMTLYRGLRLVIRTVAEWMDEISRSDTVKAFMEAVGELVAVVLELFNAVWDVAMVALKELFGGFDDTKHAYSFRDALKEVVKTITAMLRFISATIRKLSEFFRLMKDNTLFRKFWKGIGEVVKEFTNLVGEALKTVGKLGQALLLLVKGDFKGAKNLAGSAIKDYGRRLFGNAGGETNEEKIWSWAKAEGLSDVGAAAIMGNLRQESGEDFSTSASQDGSDFKIDGKTGYGLVQWTSENRQRGLKDMADQMGRNVSDLDVQLAYMKKELQEYGLWDYLKSADDLREATKKVHDEYEGSDDYNRFGGIEHRQDFSAEYYGRHHGKTYFRSQDVDENGDAVLPREQRMAGTNLDRRYFRKWSSVEGMDTPWESNDVTDTLHFMPITVDMLNALGEAFGRAFNGAKLVITGGAEEGFHQGGTYSHENGYKVDISDSLSSEQLQFVKDWLDDEENQRRYGVLYNHERDKNHLDIVAGSPMAMPTASFMPNYEVKPLGSFMGGNTETQNPFGVGLPNLSDLQKMVQDGILTPMRESMPDGVMEKMVQRLQNIDPAILGGLAGGMPFYARSAEGSGSSTTTITIGDIKVTVEGGANASAQDIARATHKEFLDQVQSDARFMMGSRALIGSTM